MNRKIHAAYAAKVRVLKALSHPSRLLMVEELGRGERCVCELVELVGSDFSTVSKHLLLLKQAGLVKDDKRGLKVFYRLRAPCVLKFTECIEALLGAQGGKRGRRSGIRMEEK